MIFSNFILHIGRPYTGRGPRGGYNIQSPGLLGTSPQNKNGFWGLVPRAKMDPGDQIFFILFIIPLLFPYGPIWSHMWSPEAILGSGDQIFFFSNSTSGPQRPTYPLETGPQRLFWALGTRFFFFANSTSGPQTQT